MHFVHSHTYHMYNNNKHSSLSLQKLLIQWFMLSSTVTYPDSKINTKQSPGVWGKTNSFHTIKMTFVSTQFFQLIYYKPLCHCRCLVHTIHLYKNYWVIKNTGLYIHKSNLPHIFVFRCYLL